MYEYEQVKPTTVTPLFQKKERVEDVPESVRLSTDSRLTLRQIQTLPNWKYKTPEEVVAQALEVLRVISTHLSHQDTKIILHTQGESLQTLHLRKSTGSSTNEVRTVHKELYPPKAMEEHKSYS